VNDNINNKESMMKLFTDNIEMKNRMNERKGSKVGDYMSSYNREVTMSQYVTIPKSRLRRLIITEVIAWGIAGFILLISLIR